MPRGNLFVKNQVVKSESTLVPKNGDVQNLSEKAATILPKSIIDLTPFTKE
jgi:hypothetical protein